MKQKISRMLIQVMEKQKVTKKPEQSISMETKTRIKKGRQ